MLFFCSMTINGSATTSSCSQGVIALLLLWFLEFGQQFPTFFIGQKEHSCSLMQTKMMDATISTELNDISIQTIESLTCRMLTELNQLMQSILLMLPCTATDQMINSFDGIIFWSTPGAPIIILDALCFHVINSSKWKFCLNQWCLLWLLMLVIAIHLGSWWCSSHNGLLVLVGSNCCCPCRCQCLVELILVDVDCDSEGSSAAIVQPNWWLGLAAHCWN